MTFVVTEAITCCRVYAMYGGKKLVIVSFLGLLFCSCTISLVLWLVAYSPGNSVVSAHLVPGFKMCAAVPSKNIVYAATIPHLIFDGLACAMLVYRVYAYRETLTKNPLLSVIQRDTTIYFFTNFALYITNLLLLHSGSSPLGPLFIGVTVSLESVLGNRMLLNLRAVDADAHRSPQTSETAAISFTKSAHRSGPKRGESFLSRW